ncbi:MAG TPA: LCP family protein, partial [Clostridiales bacterium]|nr:LCP family protein [Clostridiales bacterium]
MPDIYFSHKSDTQEIPSVPSDGNFPSSKPKKSTFKRIVKIIFSLLIVLAVVFTGLTSYIFSLMQKTDYTGDYGKNNVYVSKSDLLHDKDVINVLLIGIDARANDVASRSDSMMLFTIDKINKKIKLTSFMRDTWVTLPKNKSYAKLNASCTYGGAEYVIDTIEYNFNVDIDSYALVDFESFMSIVDSLGGVEVEVTKAEAANLRNEFFLNVEAGENVHLDGNEALWYCRIRYLDSDFMRTFRQRKVLTALFNKASKAGIIKLISIANEVLPLVETNLSPSELTKLSIYGALFYRSYEIEQA